MLGTAVHELFRGSDRYYLVAQQTRKSLNVPPSALGPRIVHFAPSTEEDEISVSLMDQDPPMSTVSFREFFHDTPEGLLMSHGLWLSRRVTVKDGKLNSTWLLKLVNDSGEAIQVDRLTDAAVICSILSLLGLHPNGYDLDPGSYCDCYAISDTTRLDWDSLKVDYAHLMSPDSSAEYYYQVGSVDADVEILTGEVIDGKRCDGKGLMAAKLFRPTWFSMSPTFIPPSSARSAASSL